jgi:hypothetical protein
MLVVLVLAVMVALPAGGPAAGADPCTPPVTNEVACENTKPGDPPSDWQVSGIGDSSIQGFASSMSVNVGQTIDFKIKTPASSYHLDILRLGYYGGSGARLIASNIRPSASLPQSQPNCTATSSTGLVECGNWRVSASWTVPSTAVSGLYIAHLVRDDTGGDSQIFFVVRKDSSHSDVLVKTSDETWQAYNAYGGNSLYTCTVSCPSGSPAGYKAAYAVSYNRPFDGTIQTDSGFSDPFYAEYQLIRFLERNGYDLSYVSAHDVEANGALLQNHRVFVSSGHDEYWTGGERQSVEAARAAGVSLAFFSGNEVFWKTRWVDSSDGTGTPYRTLVTYKDTHFPTPVDPLPGVTTSTWRDPRFSPPRDAGRPENALTGQLFLVNSGTSEIKVPAAFSRLRFWRNTAVSTLNSGQTLTLAPGTGTLGYEWDVNPETRFRPAGRIPLSSTTVSGVQTFTDYGTEVQDGTTANHSLSLYRAPSGALVFGAGTVQWSWGLDVTNAWNNTGPDGSAPDPTMQQATVNLLADMGAQPATLQSPLIATPASTDTTPPTATISTPANGASVADGTTVTISGTASDGGGGVVAAVEVSTDGGASWHLANGTTSWSYTWVAHGWPAGAISARAVDDSANIGAAGGGRSVTINCPCSLFNGTAPAVADAGDSSSVELGVKFRSDVPGTVSGIRFYKSTANTGTHVGSLWKQDGTLLASATFGGESSSGWQQVNFSSPVAIEPNTTYVAGYFAPRGHYSASELVFNRPPALGPETLDSPPLHVLPDNESGGNGLYQYTGSSLFPQQTFKSENYWVDVAFNPTGLPQPPGPVTNVSAAGGAQRATVSWTPPTNGGTTVSYRVTPYIAGVAQTPVTVSAPASSTTISGLTAGTTYTFTVTAVNSFRSGPESAPSNPVTPTMPTRPDPPTAVTATAGALQAAVSWTPAGDGGSPITGYRITPYVGGTAQAATTVPPPASAATISGLAAGTTYTFTVAALNAIGPSAESASSNPVTPTTTPALAIDNVVSAHQNSGATSITSPAFSTSTPGEQLLALIASDGPPGGSQSFSSVNGGGLTWRLRRQTNTQPGTSEIWQAVAPSPLNNATVTATRSNGSYAGSITVVSFLGGETAVDGATAGASAGTGGPSITLTTTRANSWVWGVGNDWDSATPRTVGPNQTKVDEFLASIGDTFWVQRQNELTPLSGAQVTLNDTAPTGDRWNLAAIEVQAAAAAGTAAPTLSSTIPPSPANQNSPRVVGSAVAGSQVVLYSTSNCSGSPLASGSAAELAAGITIAVADNSTTAVRATATAAGSTSACSAPLTFVEDSNAPQTQIGAHPASLSSSAAASFEFSGEDPGGSGTASFQCRLDSSEAGAWSACSSPKGYAGLADGPHRFEVRAIDGAGNVDASPAAFEWQIDTVPPGVLIDAGPSGTTSDSTPTFEFHSPDPGVSFACSIDTGTAGFGACSGPGNSHTPAAPLADNSYTFRVRATDAAGNQATATRAFTVQTVTVPAPTLTSTVPSSPANQNAPKVLGTAAAGSQVSVYSTSGCSGVPLATGSAAELGAGITIAVADNSTTALRATATAEGSTSACSAPLTYVEDSTPPDTAITSGPTGSTTDSTPTFGFSATEQNAGFECRFDAAAFGPCSGPGATHTPAAPLSEGAHTFEVRARDQAGNADQTPAARSFTVAAVTAPGAPTAVTAVAVSSGAQLSWTAPAGDGGSPITGYRITPYVGGSPQTATTTPTNATSAALSGLTNGTTYTFTVAAINAGGPGSESSPSAPITPYATIFDLATPGTVDSNDNGAVELGVKFSSDVAGTVNGIRFYKAAANTGTHVGSLWTGGGALLAQATFSGESASGWQQVKFSSPVAILANSTYVAGYLAPKGHYSVNGPNLAAGVDKPPLHAISNAISSNGVYRYGSSAGFPSNSYQASNYWVDVLFTPNAQLQAPGAPTNVAAVAGPGEATVGWAPPASEGGSAITSYRITPYIGATAQAPTTVTAPADSATIGGLTAGTTYTFTARAVNAVGAGPESAPSNAVVPAAGGLAPGAPSGVTAAARSGSALLSWNAPTSDGGSAVTSYRITPYIGSTAQAPTTVSAPATSATVPGLTNGTGYTFTVAALNGFGAGPDSVGSNPVVPRATIFEQSVPAEIEDADPLSVELGVKFNSDSAGRISGVRFYKGPGNSGPHIVGLWTAGGVLLAEATATGETASGWQEVPFASPVSIAANTTYVAGYLAPAGHYSVMDGGFNSAVDSPPLHALANSVSPNGVYAYGPSPAFPTSSFNASNYAVDVMFTP